MTRSGLTHRVIVLRWQASSYSTAEIVLNPVGAGLLANNDDAILPDSPRHRSSLASQLLQKM
jgi:hypothetical protein